MLFPWQVDLLLSGLRGRVTGSMTAIVLDRLVWEPKEMTLLKAHTRTSKDHAIVATDCREKERGNGNGESPGNPAP